MNNPKLIFRQAPAATLLALLFASVVGAMLIALRVSWTGNLAYASLIWNLFLAWLPLLFALDASHQYRVAGRGSWRVCLSAALWLLFFPNAPYIFTDLIHVKNWWPLGHYWMDLSLVLVFAFTGFLLGFISLYLMQSVVANRFGKKAGWLFICAVAALSGFGVYLGRVLRWNSWDVFVHPVGLTRSIVHWVTHPLANPGIAFGFPALFATFLFLAYLMLYALTHLQPRSDDQSAA
jgi:uncharacterized membrane protein